MAVSRFMQANLNHCARAQDLLVQSLAQWQIQVAIVAEPYRVPSRGGWVGDDDGSVAIVTRTAAGAPPLERVSRGRGWVAGEVDETLIVAVYFSPNASLSRFERYLRELETLVASRRSRHVLVAGDLNAKSAMWGSAVTNARGRELEDWAVAGGFTVMNVGGVDTCVRRAGGSIVDVTFATSALARRISAWEVLEGVETLSDHRYVRFDVSALSTIPVDPWRPLPGDPPRWALRKLDRELLLEAAEVEAWTSRPTAVAAEVDVEEEAEWLRLALSRACDAAMPRLRCQAPWRHLYWWSAEIAALRADAARARRAYTRSRRRSRRDLEEEDRLYAVYRVCVEALSSAIGAAKDASYEEFLSSLDADPWGRPYRMVRDKLRPWAPPLTRSLQPELVDRVVSVLFPPAGDLLPPPMARPLGMGAVEEDDDGEVPEVTEVELGAALLRLRGRRKAPGLDGVPGRAVFIALDPLEERFRALLTACLVQGLFPRQWKAGKLVLLKKDGRPEDSPSAYRPLVLLDEAGKLFERVLVARLVRHMEDVGPNLSDAQYGFRRAHSTIDAIRKVKVMAEEAIAGREVLLAVSLDISNAFNSLPWTCVEEALRYHGFPGYLRRIIGAYLSEREVRYPARLAWEVKPMTRGVPQGSALGPTLWNIGYDWVLRGALPEGVSVTCYADDTLVTARGASFDDAAARATEGVQCVLERIRRLGLEVALPKCEALCFHGPRRAPLAGARVMVGGVWIDVGVAMRYLGIVLDPRLTFCEHFRRLVPRLMAACGALSRLLPNVGGPNAPCRRLYVQVVRSMALYGAPVWEDALGRANKALLRRPQRVMCLRVVHGYRTISFEAACVLAACLPWELDARVLTAVYDRVVEHRSTGEPLPREGMLRWRRKARRRLLLRWMRALEEPSAGHDTIDAVRPVLERWVTRRHGVLSFHLTQILSGHGCFGRYLWRVAGAEPTPECHHCGNAEDTARHTLAECSAWAVERAELVAVVGADLSLPSIVRSIVHRESAWDALAEFADVVMTAKEDAERLRERDPQARLGRRTRRRPGTGVDRQSAENRRVP